MKTLRITFAFLALFGLVTTGAVMAELEAGADTDTATAQASAQVIAKIEISKDEDLNFGEVVASTAAGTVVLAPAGGRVAAGGVTLGGSGHQAAGFSVAGQGTNTYDITLPDSIVIEDGENNMTVDAFTHNGVGALAAGAESFDVGATLNVGIEQAAGSYTGNFNVTVTYN